MVITTREERVRAGEVPSPPSKSDGAGLPPDNAMETIGTVAPRKNGKRFIHRDAFAAIFFLAPSLGGFMLFVLIPIVGSILIAFTVWPVAGVAHWTGFDNFWTLFNEDKIFVQSIYNTLFFVVTYVPANIVLSLALAVWISPRIRGRNYYRFILFIPVVAPMIANAAIWRIMLVPNGLIDSLSGVFFGVHAPNYLGLTSTAMITIVVMSLWQGFGYNLMVFASALEAVPENLTEAAALDGAGAIRQFFSIKLPMISPAVFFGTTMTIITSFQVFAQCYVLTNGGPSFQTQTLVMTLYQQGFQYQRLGYASAIGVVLFLGILAVSGLVFAAQKKLVHYE
jgi:multiple sugar transport system permease protein